MLGGNLVCVRHRNDLSNSRIDDPREPHRQGMRPTMLPADIGELNNAPFLFDDGQFANKCDTIKRHIPTPTLAQIRRLAKLARHAFTSMNALGSQWVSQ